MNQNFKIFVVALLVIVLACSPHIKAQSCQTSEGKTGTEPSEQCNTENNSECCVEGRFYETYECSPPVSSSTEATLTLNSFQEGGDGGGASACDGSFHSDGTAVVALSTGWYDKRSRCGNFITINGNGRSVQAKVVDECDSTTGCDKEHAYQPPCRNNIVDASKAVWEALGVSEDNWGELEITWSDA
ncbi:hypothetical protein M8C21_002655 [Ambrosia artemisiifolia]|uniref:Ripening-related protein 1 n=1 Tax=Ambrosia artemisiifolia TaxID=4212 RepID=A0AAD5D4L8_AMBAR|nr:hypothetical protein M8C21_002655 [Ambrosia artemisiifolia]